MNPSIFRYLFLFVGIQFAFSVCRRSPLIRTLSVYQASMGSLLLTTFPAKRSSLMSFMGSFSVMGPCRTTWHSNPWTSFPPVSSICRSRVAFAGSYPIVTISYFFDCAANHL